MLFCAGSARVAAFKYLQEIYIYYDEYYYCTWEPLHNNLGDLENIYVENLGTLREPLQYNLGNLDNLYNGNLGNLEGTFTMQPRKKLEETLTI